MYAEILTSFITLFIIIDPFISAVFLLSQFKNASSEQKSKAIWTAILVAGAMLFIFLFTGLYILGLLGISFDGFRVAGGIILLILGITTVLGIEFGTHHDKLAGSAILIGTPLLSGPGALTTIIVLSKEYGLLIPAIAAIIVLVISFFMLKFAHLIQRVLGTDIIEVCSKVLGLLLSALAVDFIYLGIKGLIAGG
jgi:multiple antibiotic resistance protein